MDGSSLPRSLFPHPILPFKRNTRSVYREREALKGFAGVTTRSVIHALDHGFVSHACSSPSTFVVFANTSAAAQYLRACLYPSPTPLLAYARLHYRRMVRTRGPPTPLQSTGPAEQFQDSAACGRRFVSGCSLAKREGKKKLRTFRNEVNYLSRFTIRSAWEY